MNALDMYGQSAFLRKPRSATAALIWFLAIVHPLVILTGLFVKESLWTQLTLEAPFLEVHIPNVVIQRALLNIAYIFRQTLRTLVWLRNAVHIVHVRSPTNVFLER